VWTQHLRFKIVTGTRYLGGHIGEDDFCVEWVKEKLEGWIEGVKALTKVARNSLKYAVAGLQKILQSEWMVLQRATSEIEPIFAPAEEVISTYFFSTLICTDPTAGTPPSLRLLSLPCKLAGTGVPIPPDTTDTQHPTRNRLHLYSHIIPCLPPQVQPPNSYLHHGVKKHSPHQHPLQQHYCPSKTKLRCSNSDDEK